MNDSPVISVLVPSYNAAGYLVALCRSIQMQTLERFQVIIADDGSTDETEKTVAPFLSDPRFEYHRLSTNRGLGFCLLLLLQRARGEFWCSPGADDLLDPDFLERRVAKLCAFPEAVLVHGKPRYINERSEEIIDPFGFPVPPSYLNGGEALHILLQHNIINQPSSVVRRSVTRTVLPYYFAGWKYAPDWFLWILHVATGCAVLYDDEPVHRYRIHSASLTQATGLGGLRRAEIRLVPLCSLSAATAFSLSAQHLWGRWRKTLYALWLRRVLALAREGGLHHDWLEVGARAYYGIACNHVSLMSELVRHTGSIILSSVQERHARQRQHVRVSGLAQLDHPMFRRP